MVGNLIKAKIGTDRQISRRKENTPDKCTYGSSAEVHRTPFQSSFFILPVITFHNESGTLASVNGERSRKCPLFRKFSQQKLLLFQGGSPTQACEEVLMHPHGRGHGGPRMEACSKPNYLMEILPGVAMS
ncbi:unnamed protein product [Allacma fusca]|uniref:Uncharacterized protein n=1 Tax=Allacma fusca TaxID=39272 RepID=A0A8J2Q0H3_9HEXA|nr:unnamed protein product [Allacma fusca]